MTAIYLGAVFFLLLVGAPFLVTTRRQRNRSDLQTFAQHGREWRESGNAGVCPCEFCNRFRLRFKAPTLTRRVRAR